MITHEKVNGKWATVSHLNDKWEPVDKSKSTLVKVVFDSGGVLFAARKKKEERSGPQCYEYRDGTCEWF